MLRSVFFGESARLRFDEVDIYILFFHIDSCGSVVAKVN